MANIIVHKYARRFSIAHLDEGRNHIMSRDRILDDTFGLMAKRESGPVK